MYHVQTFRTAAEPRAPRLPTVWAVEDAAWSVLSHLEATYPGFGVWFWRTTVPGLLDGSRRIILNVHDDQVMGVAIAKRGLLERKICTLWVRPEARGTGLGADLMNEAIDWLEDRHPLLTVPEERLPEFLPICEAHHFMRTQALRSIYRFGKIEYVFNGFLCAPVSAEPREPLLEAIEVTRRQI